MRAFSVPSCRPERTEKIMPSGKGAPSGPGGALAVLEQEGKDVR
ncbi:hypothetical protein [Streptomyces sp. NPDC001020]